MMNTKNHHLAIVHNGVSHISTIPVDVDPTQPAALADPDDPDDFNETMPSMPAPLYGQRDGDHNHPPANWQEVWTVRFMTLGMIATVFAVILAVTF